MFNNQEFKNTINSVNTTNNIQQPQQVTPIPEVPVQTNANVEEVKTTPQNNKPPKSSKLSTFLLILLFVFLFGFVMFMPNINSFIEEYKANKKSKEPTQEVTETPLPTVIPTNQPTPTPSQPADTVILNELVCTSSTQKKENYVLVEVQKFSYNSVSKQVVNSSLDSHYRFTLVDNNYNSIKEQCNYISSKYMSQGGYEVSCNYDGNDINIYNKFDLKDFTSIADGTVNIVANATYNQNIDEIKTSLIGKGYTCE